MVFTEAQLLSMLCGALFWGFVIGVLVKWKETAERG